jgi:peptidoglycan/LPS O-acetylase OafA/YrhL
MANDQVPLVGNDIPTTRVLESKPAHIDALTSPRFLFGVYVLAKHAGWSGLKAIGLMPKPLDTLMSNAETAVSYFFTMSGFVLAYVYLNKFKTPGTVPRFARARFARVYPVYLLAIALMLPFMHYRSLISDLPQFFGLQSWLPQVDGTDRLLSNWVMESWTLSVEVFCYITFPFVIRMMEDRSDRVIYAFTIFICVLMVGLRLPGTDNEEHTLFRWLTYVPYPLIRWPEFLYGVALAIIFRRGLAPKSPAALHMCIGLLLILLVAKHNLWLYGINAVLSGLIVLLLTTSASDSPLGRLLTSKTGVMLGRASYSLYILQLPVYLILHSLVPPSAGILGKVIYIPLMIILSVIVFHFYEEPLHKRLRHAPNSKLAAPITG